MAFITKNLPGLYGGVSQQNPAIRPENCTQDQLNSMVSITEGIKLKRPPSALISGLTITGTSSESFVAELKTTRGEYLMMITGHATTPVNIFTKTGVKANITYEDAAALSYLLYSSVLPKDKLRAMTTQDYTFILNNQKTVAMTTGIPAGYADGIGYINVLTGLTGIDFSVDLKYNGISIGAPITGTTASTETNVIAGEIRTAILTNPITHPFDANIPSSAISTVVLSINGHIVDQGGTYYVCKKSHTADTVVTMPGVGSSWTTYWDVYTGTKTGPAWVNLRKYVGYSDASSTYITVGVSDGAGNSMISSVSSVLDSLGMRCVASKLSDLPESAVYSVPFEIVGDTQSSSGYYVRYDLSYRTYREIPFPSKLQSLDAETMPVLLVQYDDLLGIPQFTLRLADSTDEYTENYKRSGDNTSNPNPSFVGNKITNMFFFKNRLSFISGENISMSQSLDYFNFFATTAAEVLDSDPIDISPDSDDYCVITDVTPLDQILLLFSGKQQFILHSGQRALTTKTVAIEPASSFVYNQSMRPRLLGSNVYFSEVRNKYLMIREYSTQDGTITYDADNINPFLTEYIPYDFDRIIPVPNLDLLLITKRSSTDIYVYQFLWRNGEKLLSSWHKWTFSDTCVTYWQFGSDLYILQGTNLFRVKLDGFSEYTSTPFVFHLDKSERKATGSYSSITGLTTWSLSMTPVVGTSKLIVESTGKELAFSNPSGTIVTAEGDYSSTPVIHGFPYESYVDLSEVTIRDQNNVALPNVDIRIQKIIVEYQQSGFLRLQVIPAVRTGTTYDNWFLKTGTSGDSADGTVVLKTDRLKQMVMTSSKGCTIRLYSNSYLPCILKSLALELDVVKETQ